jgi:hypothetical protein
LFLLPICSIGTQYCVECRQVRSCPCYLYAASGLSTVWNAGKYGLSLLPVCSIRTQYCVECRQVSSCLCYQGVVRRALQKNSTDNRARSFVNWFSQKVHLYAHQDAVIFRFYRKILKYSCVKISVFEAQFNFLADILFKFEFFYCFSKICLFSRVLKPEQTMHIL